MSKLFIRIVLFHLSIFIYGQLNTPTIINGVSVPQDFPKWAPTINSQTAPGYIWINNWNGTPYVVMFQNDGTPAFYQKVEDRSRDFKIHPNGMISRRFRPNPNGFLVYGTDFNLLDTVFAQNGYRTDEHELHIAPNGNYLIITLEDRYMDLSGIGGSPNARVVGNHIQELDSDLNVVFEWLCWDNIELNETYASLIETKVDHIHMNSIAIDYDGHIVISCRHMSQCFKIHRTTGEFIWRLGGKKSDLTFVNDSFGISFQHDIRPVPGSPNSYTIFDNGTQHTPKFSRAVEYSIDTSTRTATQVWDFQNERSRYSNFMGNVQRLPNGNTFINYATKNAPKAVEVTTGGDIVYEANWADEIQTYRAFRFEWNGKPKAPYLLVESNPSNLSLLFNKFNDSTLSYYRIYADTFNPPTTLLDTTCNTWYNVINIEKNTPYYFKVSAIDTLGNESEFSGIETGILTELDNYTNLIVNGDFSDNTNNWDFSVEGNAIAKGFLNDSNYFEIEVTSPGSAIHNIQLKQTGIKLFEGIKYIFRFDAFVANPRLIEAKVGENTSPWTNYSKIGYTYLEPGLHTYEYEFVMDYATETDCRAVFNFGEYNGNAQIKNIELIQIVDEDTATALTNNYYGDLQVRCSPNPCIHNITFNMQIEKTSDVKIDLYNLYGQLIKTITKNNLHPGNYNFDMNTLELPAGQYIYKITANDIRGVSKSLAGKILKIK